MKVGVDSYSYHRLFGEIYPNQIEPGKRWQFEQCLEEVIRLAESSVGPRPRAVGRSDDELGAIRQVEVAEVGRDVAGLGQEELLPPDQGRPGEGLHGHEWLRPPRSR